MIPIYCVDCIISITNSHSKILNQLRTISPTQVLNIILGKYHRKTNTGNEYNCLFLSLESFVFYCRIGSKTTKIIPPAGLCHYNSAGGFCLIVKEGDRIQSDRKYIEYPY